MEHGPENDERDRPVRDGPGDDIGQPDVRHGTAGRAEPLGERRQWADPIVGDEDRALDGDEGGSHADRPVTASDEAGRDEPDDRNELGPEDDRVDGLDRQKTAAVRCAGTHGRSLRAGGDPVE